MSNPHAYVTEGKHFEPVIAKMLELGLENCTLALRKHSKTMGGDPCWVVAMTSAAAETKEALDGPTEWEFNYVFPCPGGPIPPCPPE